MEKSTSNKENRQRVGERRKSDKVKKSYASNKPWWLVIFIMVLLAGFLFYVRWLNSPAAKEYRSFWAYLVEPKSTAVISDSSAAPEDDIASLFGNDSTPGSEAGFADNEDEWAQGTSAPAKPSESELLGNSSNRVAENTPVSAPSPAPPTVAPASSGGGTVYVINAGEFKTKGSAQFRVSELRQGNYRAQLIEPTSPDGIYKVVVGEYQNEETAQTVARSMSFILEIKASVEERR
ncbi:SPOR domain-containing protein [Persicitalea sp.]|uniref:SPOR domain-containing protein n=1 Tax=Persicitalea sp. TaxID=3100273 RepID=UPI0035934C0A